MERITENPRALLTALEGTDIGIFILDPDFSVRWINETAEEYFGLDREEVLGKDKQTLIESTIKSSFERPDRFAETVIDTYEDNTYVEEFECHVLPGDGRTERWLLHRSKPIEDGELAGGRVEHYTDITDRKEREQNLERQNDRLEQFASVVSHDLRNPLSTASLRLELAREDNDGEQLESASDALSRMERIIEDMLWLAREGQDIGSTEPVDLRESIETTWAFVTAGATRSELVLADDDLGTINADSDRFRQLLENLLSNAVDHGGTDVTVTVGRLPDGFYVADDGPGVPAADRETVFESGYSTEAEGTGFGLSIVKQIVDAHGWTIRVTDAADGGARFEITGIDVDAEGPTRDVERR